MSDNNSPHPLYRHRFDIPPSRTVAIFIGKPETTTTYGIKIDFLQTRFTQNLRMVRQKDQQAMIVPGTSPQEETTGVLSIKISKDEQVTEPNLTRGHMWMKEKFLFGQRMRVVDLVLKNEDDDDDAVDLQVTLVICQPLRGF